MRWFNRYNFPYSNFHDLNLDWILSEMTRIREEWETVKAEWEQMKIDWQQFQERMERLWQEYKDLMNRLWAEFKAQLEGEWEDYQRQMDEAWELYQQELNQAWATYQQTVNGRLNDQDTKIANLESAWATYQQTVNQILANMQTQIDNFMNDMRNYITQQLPSIAEPLIKDWLDGIDPASLLLKDLPIVTPEMYGAIGDGVTNDTVAWSDCLTAARDEGKMIVCAPRATYLVPSWTDRAGVTILGNQSTIKGNAIFSASGSAGSVSVSDLSVSGYIQISSSNKILKNVSCGRLEQIGNVSDILIDGIKITESNSMAQNVYDFSLSGVSNTIITHVFPYAIGTSFYLDEAVRSVIDDVAGPATIKPAGGHTCEWIVSNVGGAITYVAPSDPTGVAIKTPSLTTLQ